MDNGRLIATPYKDERGRPLCLVTGQDGLGNPTLTLVAAYGPQSWETTRPRKNFTSLQQARAWLNETYKLKGTK